MTTRFQRGGAVSPLTASTSNALLRDADPTLYRALEFARALLTRHVQPRFAAELAKAGFEIANNPDGYVVGSALPFDPTLYPLEGQITFPLLAVWRSEERYDEQTSGWRRARASWVVDWLLPPLTAQDAARLTPIVRTVANALHWGFERGLDETGDSKWHLDGYVDTVRVIASKFAAMELRDASAQGRVDQVYAGVSMQLELEERILPVLGDFERLEEIQSSIALVPTNGDEVIEDFLQVDLTDLHD